MVEFKLVISDPKTGRSVQRIAKDDTAKRFLGTKIGEIIKGETIDLAGYEFQITGGSDDCGFPMRKDIEGPGRVRILSGKTTGLYIKEKGGRRRKTVVGNTVSSKTSQINLKITKYGKESIFPEKPKEENSSESEVENKEIKSEEKKE